MPDVLDDLSAMERVIFLWVWESVEWGRNESLVLNTAWPCRPDTQFISRLSYVHSSVPDPGSGSTVRMRIRINLPEIYLTRLRKK